jgi:hypothetical protein
LSAASSGDHLCAQLRARQLDTPSAEANELVSRHCAAAP